MGTASKLAYSAWQYTQANCHRIKREFDKVIDDIASAEAAIAAITTNSLAVCEPIHAHLNGVNPTAVKFQTATAAVKAATINGPFNFAPNDTLLLTVDGGSEQTVTFAATAGTSVSGSSPSTDISSGADTKIKISVDGDTAEEVELTLTGLTSGAAIATELQTKIRAKGGSKAAVTVAYTTVYTITSATQGTGSSVVVTQPASGSLLEELKLGAEFGTETAGTGDVANIDAVTAAEVVTMINGDTTGCTATVVSGKVTITSDTTGKDSKIVFGNGNVNGIITGFANTTTVTGAASLGLDYDMADANYVVMPVMSGSTTVASRNLSINNKSTTGFEIYCETAGATDVIDLLIVGTKAS